MGILDDLAELFDAEITAQPGTLDGAGTWVASGSPTVLPARFEGGARLVRAVDGQQVVSSVLAIIKGLLPSNDPATLRFTIPATFQPNAEIQALRIDPVFDEDGPLYTEVSLP